MARLARIVLTGTRTDDELDPMTLDLFLDEGRRVAQSFPTSGWWGRFKGSGDFEPFVFFPSGTMDFGTGFDEEDRHASTNIQTKRLDVGEYVTVNRCDYESCFVVKQVLWLDELQAAA